MPVRLEASSYAEYKKGIYKKGLQGFETLQACDTALENYHITLNNLDSALTPVQL